MSSLQTVPSETALKVLKLRKSGNLKVLNRSEILKEIKGIKIPDKADAVFEGGGVKGIALAGALEVAEALGVKWQKVAGTSAGAIMASLLAAGYNSKELTKILTKDLNFMKFMDKGLIDKIPIIGKIASALFEKGIYEGEYFEDWMVEILDKKGIQTFGDLKDEKGEYRLRVIASDVTRRELLVLPDDLKDYGRDPDSFSVAKAVRMSMSIPYFFEPVEMDFMLPSGKQKKAYIVDGGLLSNFPVWLFDAKGNEKPKWPTYGFKLVGPGENTPSPTKWPLQYIFALVNTMMEAHDKAHIDSSNFERTIPIPTLDVQTTQFDLGDKEKTLLVRSGQEAAIKFFKNWKFDEHNEKYRT